MNNSFTDTIIALATPLGTSALATIRLSGQRAIEIVQTKFKGKNLELQNSHTVHLGFITHNNKIIDEVLVTIFKDNKSFTGENSVEISCHGSAVIIKEIISAMVSAGARLAEPGEFSKRAFLNGKYDLTQVEAIADLINAETENAKQVAFTQMRGGFSKRLREYRQRLIDFVALIELELDFSEEDAEFANRNELKELALAMRQSLKPLLASYKLGNVIKQGINAVIAGKPNTGKSTLLNTLLQEEKSIVSEISGTTRDAIEDTINIEGINFRFIDTAGLHNTTDPIESLGIARTNEKLKKAQLILYLFDLSNFNITSFETEKQKIESLGIPYILIGNKVDIAQTKDLDKLTSKNFLFISAKEEINIEELKMKILSLFHINEIKQGDVLITNIRHIQHLEETDKSLERVISGIESKLSTDLLAQNIKHAMYSVGAITGEEITSEHLLESIFSKFCIGK